MVDQPDKGLKQAPLRPLADRIALGMQRELAPDEALPAEAHPKIGQIVGYWRSLMPGPGLLPGRQHFDPVAVPALLSNLWLLDVVPDDPRRFRLRLVGGALIDAGWRGRKGLFYSDAGASEEEARRATELFERLVATRRIYWRRGPSALGHMEHIRQLERVMLPMAGDGTGVDMFLCLTVLYHADGRET